MRKLILDLDTGIDDAFALAYALAHPDLELIGVTGTYGNVTVEQGVGNTLALLEVLGRPDVPVYAGVPHASDKESFTVLDISAFIHGANGIGNVDIPPASTTAQPGSAVEFLTSAVAEHGRDLVIVPTGASTTIAAACAADPAFTRDAHIVFMGGALTVPGNVTAWSEANVHQDPAATDTMLRQAQDITMVGLDVTLQTLLTTQHTAQWEATGTRAGQVYAQMANYYISAYGEIAPYLGGCGLHDPLAVAIAADESLAGFLDINLKVEVEGPTRGRTIGDEAAPGVPQGRRSRAAVGVDAQRFVAEFSSRLTDFFAAN